MAGLKSYFKLFLAALIVLNFSIVSAQMDNCANTTMISRTVYEDTEANSLVIDFGTEFNHTDPGLLFFATVNTDQNTRYVSVVYLDHFERTESRIRTKHVIDRDRIAKDLRNTYAPVVFPVSLAVVQTRPSRIQVCYEMTLTVVDKNDNAPRFIGYENGERYQAFLNEGDTNAEHSIARALDDDEGVNSTIFYQLEDDLGKFRLEIDRAHGSRQVLQVLLKLQENVTLNYEEETDYNLTIIAKEGNANPRNATLLVHVAVIDVCDESPFFPMSAYFPRVRENSPINTVINANITAIDQDLIDQDRLEYEIRGVRAPQDGSLDSITDYPFALDRETGVLTLTGELDREVYEEYEISVHATDGCGRSATASVMVTVDDENDNAPVVRYEGIRNTPENLPESTRIGFITVTDSDAGVNAEFTVELFENSTGTLVPSQTFQLIEETSEILIRSTLDREDIDSYSLVIQVIDHGTPSLETLFPLEITVTDFNDNPPVIDRTPIQSEYEVHENRPINTVIVTLVANDSDIGGNGLVSFLLPSTNEMFPHQHLFTIDEFAGSLKVAGTLNREQQDRIQVLVVARDNPTSEVSNEPQLTDHIVINITLLDLNDNTPDITFPTGTYSISENYTVNSEVFQVEASDPDTRMFSTLTYSLEPNDTPFQINPNTGSVTLIQSLDYDSEPRSYSLVIRADDGTNTGEEQLTILLQDDNDEPPRFTPLPQYSALVNESESVGYLVKQVSAADPDTASSLLRFEIVSGNIQRHFRIDAQSGRVYTNAMLNREAISRYNLTISVFDGVNYALQNAFLDIMVIDVNDNIPYFLQTSYQFSVYENRPNNTMVGTIEARDPDLDLNGEVRYRIQRFFPEATTGWFYVDPVSGLISTRQVLNRESTIITPFNSQVTLLVGARDLSSPSENDTTVTITILDQNDERPRFAQDRIVLTLNENHPIGSTFHTVQAVDGDLPPFNMTRYSVDDFPPNARLLFHIDIDSGALSLLSTLDYEHQQQHNISITAKDANQEIWFARQMITINVLNTLELSLKCDDFFPLANVTENIMIGQPVTSFECTNISGDPLERIEYNLTNPDGSPSTYFGIREELSNGRSPATVYTLRNIDRDTLPKLANGVVQISVLITARDPRSPENSLGSINSTLVIRILDVNDNAPSFLRSFYKFNIDENNELHASLGFVAANDSDNGANGTVRYSILTQTPAVPFSIDEISGEISASESIDREMNPDFDFVVVASDRGVPPLQDTVNVQVSVNDENDNPPEFDPNHNGTIYVGEEASVNSIVETLLVTDADTDRFGPITIEIAPGSTLDSHFDLHTNGSLLLSQRLDREREDFYDFTARAYDGNTDRQARFEIRVLDYNDNPPVFDSSIPTQITINESHPLMTPLITMSATDRDVGNNAKISYKLANRSLEGIFCVVPNSGQIRLCARRPHSCQDEEIIDYERQSQYDVTLLAYDMGSPRHIVNRTVTIFISNVNEHPPVFDRGAVMAYVNEGEMNAEVARLRAYDWDYDDLTYQVLEDGIQSTEFRYDGGAILTNRRLDYASTPLHILTLRALEISGDRNGSIEVEVFVKNTNNNRPVFDLATRSTDILESTPLNTVVLTAHADDADNNTHDAVSYSIISGNTDGAFDIDPLFGDIFVNKSLDFDTIDVYVLMVQATDTGFPPYSETAPFSIRLINENDETPSFDREGYFFNITENSSPGALVGSVQARDHDEGTAGMLLYSFLEDNAYFTINEMTGDIVSRVEIDRETYDSEPGNMNPVTLTVLATDQGLTDSRSASVSVQVTIIDENDNRPVFSRGLFIISIPPNQPANTTIDTIAATDLDSGVNAIPTYTITTMPSGVSLGISSSTGELYLLQALPPNHQNHYDLVVTATDSQDASLSSETRVRLVVETDNDHHPAFDNPEGVYSVSITENTPSGNSVFDVSEHVSDVDSSGPASQLTYAFAEDYSTFSINPSSGLITLVQTLDFETQTEYSLVIHASDSTPGGARTATATLNIEVHGYNDFVPAFVNLPSQITLSPVPFLQVNLFTLLAMDGDDGMDGEVEYSIDDTDHVFTVEPSTGVVRNQGVLQDGSTYSIVVSAYDRGSPILSSNATVMVNVVDPDESVRPSFAGIDSSSRTYTVDEDLAVGMPIQPALVTTPQAQTYQIVRYNGTKGMFVISQNQGQFTLRAKLNHRLESQYQLIVEARIESRTNLNNFVRHSSFIEVNIVVNDVNDNSPVFLVSTPLQIIPEDTQTGVTLFTVTATDEDSGSNGLITYEIFDGNIGRPFQINPTTGAVSLMRSLDWEEKSYYELTIRASDSNNLQPKRATTIVPISVSDINDYVPSFAGNYTIGVYEHPHVGMGDKIIKVAAIDKDEGPPLRYRLDLQEARFKGQLRTAPQDVFVINTDTGTVSVGQRTNVNREEIDYYRFLVTVTDQVNTVITFLTINVLDVNDHTPVLSVPNEGRFEPFEDLPVGEIFVDGLSYTDEDDGINSWALYSLGDGWPDGDYFVIDPVTGVIRLNNPIVNVLNGRSFDGTVILTDQGVPSRSTSRTLSITVRDVNNNAPVFEDASPVINTSLATRPGEAIYTFNVSDMDINLNKGFTLTIPQCYDSAYNTFQINSDGSLSLKDQGEPLMVGTYSFRVEAYSQSFSPSCARYVTASYASVNVVVQPENAHCPTFERSSYVFEIREEERRDGPIDRLSATDDDDNNIRYSINDTTLPFSIGEASGEFSLTSTLDREDRAYYEFAVFATDDGFPSRSCSSTITVNVLDINDNPPGFIILGDLERYEGSILENTMPNKPILTVYANDSDFGPSGQVRYSILVDDVPFYINAQSGEIFASDSLNCETKNFYEFPVVASDNGTSPMTSSTMVTIQVTGVDEFEPVFGEESYEFYITEDQVSGDTIGTVQATDEDCDQDEIFYSIEDREPLFYFRMDNTTGAIILIKDPISDTTSSPPSQNTVTKRQVNPQNFVEIPAKVKATSGEKSATVDVMLNIHNIFVTGRPNTGKPINYEIIAIVVAAVFAVICVFGIIVIIAVVFRKKKHSGIGKINDTELNNVELSSRFSSRRSQAVYTPQYKQTSLNHMAPEHTTLNHSSGSGSNSNRDSYTADDEDSITGEHNGIAYGSGKTPTKVPPAHARSTSDLASSIATDALAGASSQDTTSPYDKAQIAAIYAANVGLLANSSSHDSIHMFGSEGGGEDGDVDIGNMLFAKYNDLEDDDDEDDSTTLPDEDGSYQPPKIHRSSGNVNVPPVEERGFIYSGHVHNTSSWMPQMTPMDATINDIVNPTYDDRMLGREPAYPGVYGHSNSQGMSMYDTSTQGSRTSLIRHHTGPFSHSQQLRQPMHVGPTMSQEYGEDYREYNPPPIGRHVGSRGNKRYGSANALSGSEYHSRDLHPPPPRAHRHVESHGSGFSQEMNPPPYLHHQYHPRGIRTQSPTSSTPTDGTVTPQRAMGHEYDDDDDDLTSSSTSLGSTNISSSHDQGSITDHRGPYS